MRQIFTYKNQTIYQWEQGLDQINIYIKPPQFCLPKNKHLLPKNVEPPKIQVFIKSKHLTIGIKDLQCFCDSDQSYWMIQQDQLHIILTKAHKGQLWPCVFKGHNRLDPLTQNQTKKKLLLQRFQQQHPSFDFSQAEINGMVPDARNFLGGINYK